MWTRSLFYKIFGAALILAAAALVWEFSSTRPGTHPAVQPAQNEVTQADRAAFVQSLAAQSSTTPQEAAQAQADRAAFLKSLNH